MFPSKHLTKQLCLCSSRKILCSTILGFLHVFVGCLVFTTLLLGRSPPAWFSVQFFDIGGALSKRLAVPDVYSRRRRAYLIFSGPAAVPGASSSGRKGDKGGRTEKLTFGTLLSCPAALRHVTFPPRRALPTLTKVQI